MGSYAQLFIIFHLAYNNSLLISYPASAVVPLLSIFQKAARVVLLKQSRSKLSTGLPSLLQKMLTSLQWPQIPTWSIYHHFLFSRTRDMVTLLLPYEPLCCFSNTFGKLLLKTWHSLF